MLKGIIGGIIGTILTLVIAFFIFAKIICPIYGLSVESKKTAKLQAEKFGIAVEDTRPPVYLMQGYPSSQGFQYKQVVNLTTQPAVMAWDENEKPFWLIVQNGKDEGNYKNPKLFLNFNGKFKVKSDNEQSKGWIEFDPGFKYYIELNKEIQPQTGLILNPLFVQFPKPDVYFVEYSISGDDITPTKGIFAISVKE